MHTKVIDNSQFLAAAVGLMLISCVSVIPSHLRECWAAMAGLGADSQESGSSFEARIGAIVNSWGRRREEPRLWIGAFAEQVLEVCRRQRLT